MVTFGRRKYITQSFQNIRVDLIVFIDNFCPFFYYIFRVDESLVVFKLQEIKLMRKCKVSQYYVEMLILKVSNSEGEKGFIGKT